MAVDLATVAPRTLLRLAPLVLVLVLVLVRPDTSGTGAGPVWVAPAEGALTAQGWSPLFSDEAGRPGRLDPCVPITVSAAPAGAPPSGLGDLDEALRVVAAGSALDLVRVADGTPATVTVAWERAAGARPVVGDRVEGVTLSSVVAGPQGPVLLRAEVTLDPAQRLPPGFGPGITAGEVLLHELGHVVGLAHSGDPSSMMYPTVGAGAAVPTAGDLAGLAAMGAAAGCHPAPGGGKVTRG